jgi:rhodanese-related sulfurtransferase
MKYDNPMEMRKKITVILLLSGLVLALLPLSANRSFMVKPGKLLSDILNPEVSLTADQVAKLIVNEDSTTRFIDLRSPEEFRKLNIPGSVNIPYNDFISSDLYIYLNDKKVKNIFYSNGNFYSNYAMVYARGLGYENSYVMEGGLNEWFNTVMESIFTGERISARENALYETRTKAARLFNQINSMPDSLKATFMASNKFSARKLDGGCE